jgi:hypothetical protein
MRQSPISNLLISQSLLLPSFTLTWLLGGLALYYVAVLDRNAFNVRYASFVTPALYTLIAVGLAGFGRWWKPLPYLLLVGLSVGSVPGGCTPISTTAASTASTSPK